MKRIFIGVKVVAGSKLIKAISSFKDKLPDESIKWVSIENIHITLAFPGNTTDERIEVIHGILKDRCREFKRFEVVIKGTGVFKSMNDPKIIWAGIESSDNLTKLSNTICGDLRHIGIELEERPFNPHITIGRIRHLQKKDDLKTVVSNYLNVELQVLPVNEITLYESTLTPGGPIYTPLGIYPLRIE